MPGRPEGRLATGLVAYLCRQNWTEAITELRAAQAGLPSSLDAVRFEAFALRRLGRLAEAIATLERAKLLDPQDLLGWDSLAETQLMARRYADVVRTADFMAVRGFGTDTTTAIRAYAQLALDGNLERYRRALAPLRAGLVRGFIPDLGWRGDLMARDFAGAEKFLLESDGFLSGPGGVVNNPIAQFRALLAFAQGDRERARQSAAEARQHFEGRSWMPRQVAMVAAELAFDSALLGEATRAREEIKRSRETLEQMPDTLVESGARYLWAVTYTVLGDRDAALAELRLAMVQPSSIQIIPAFAPQDPTWDSLKSDPRFAEILRAARPL
jgi:tetratricopeptide (TPR) repeat protein